MKTARFVKAVSMTEYRFVALYKLSKPYEGHKWLVAEEYDKTVSVLLANKKGETIGRRILSVFPVDDRELALAMLGYQVKPQFCKAERKAMKRCASIQPSRRTRMKTARFIRATSITEDRFEALYKLDPPIEDSWPTTNRKTKWVVLSTLYLEATGEVDTLAFPAKKSGKVKDYLQILELSVVGEESHDTALAKGGYQINPPLGKAERKAMQRWARMLLTSAES